jgi:hypothetical protein
MARCSSQVGACEEHRRLSLMRKVTSPVEHHSAYSGVWCEGALRCENTKLRLWYYYVKIGSDPDADATAFKLRSGCYISRHSSGHHVRVGIGRKAHCNPLLLLGYAQ